MRRNRWLCAAMILLTASALRVDAADPAAHWVFDRDSVVGRFVVDRAGGNHATINGPRKWHPRADTGALLIDRDANLITIPYAPGTSTALPETAITAEAWVNIEKTVEWGGIISAARGRDNGWILGFWQSSFSFSVSTQGAGDNKITHFRTPHSLEPGRWYHVVGTYDGTTQRIYVNGKLENTSEVQSGKINYPDAAPFVIGAFHDSDGDYYRWRGWVHEVRIYDHALTADQIATNYRNKADRFDPLYQVKVGPSVKRLDRGTITLAWETDAEVPSVVTIGKTLPLADEVVDATPKTRHALTIPDIDASAMYYYRIRSGPAPMPSMSSRLYEYDATFDYSLLTPATPRPMNATGASFITTVADRAVREAGSARGYCLILGCGEGKLAYEIARRSQLRIVCIDDDADNVARARAFLDEAGVYGVQVSVQRGSLTELPFSDYTANLVVSERLLTTGVLPTPADEIFRVLRPCGGVACLGQPRKHQGARSLDAWARSASQGTWQVTDDGDATWAVLRRDPLPGSGDWSHQYGDAGNSSSSGDENLSDDLHVLWFGRPGPRPMVDRGTRAPAPVSVNGRLFVQGDRRLFGLDAYNGTMRWTLQIPDLRRANVPRDASNMAADDEALYVAVRDACWRLDADTGNLLAAFVIPADPDAGPRDWGYVARVGDLLLGTAVRRGALFVGADGEWYDRNDEESNKVASDDLFAVDHKTGRLVWSYHDGLILNATISVGDGRVYMVETRNADALDGSARRLDKDLITDKYLVALDIKTGQRLWEHYYPFNEGRWVFYLSYANGTLIALSTSDKYHIYAFDAEDGTPLWQNQFPYKRTHHGGAMHHPAIVGETVYAEPRAFNLRTGEIVHEQLPRGGGCGTISASANCLFFRDGYHTVWDLESDKRRSMTGLRPGCWLGIIPAGGLLLAPESSAGCFCAQPIQTSIAFQPTHTSDGIK